VPFLHTYFLLHFAMQLYSLSILFALAAAAQGAAVPSSHVIHEKRTQPMQTWVKRDRLSPKALLPMRIGLMQRNLERIDEFLMDVSVIIPILVEYFRLNRSQGQILILVISESTGPRTKSSKPLPPSKRLSTP
jgi:hypothetical protein